MSRPSIFIGSSTEGLDFARATRGLLQGDAEVTLWNEGFFPVGKTSIEALVDALPQFDFAILVLTPDDFVHSRQVETLSPRDNVIFELGLFMGHLGRRRTFLMFNPEATIKIPTDLAGLTSAPYTWPRSDQNHVAAVGAACDQIRRMIRELGPSERKVARELESLRDTQAEQQLQIDALAFMVRTYIPWPEYGHLWGLGHAEALDFTDSPWFKAELRRLRGLGVIRGKPGVSVEGLPSTGNLHDYFDITEVGRQYIDYRERFEALSSVGASRL